MIIKLYNKFIGLFKPKYTQTISNDEQNQCYVYKCYKNGKYTHTVNMHYFTAAQIDNFLEIGKKVQLNANTGKLN